VLGATAYGELVPVLAAAMISLLAIGVIYFRLPESNPRAVEDHDHVRSCSKTLGHEPRDSVLATQCPKRRRQRLIGDPTLFYMMAIFFVLFLGFSLFYVSFPMHAATELSWSSVEIGGFFMVLSGSLVIVEGPVLSWLSRRTSEPVRIAAGLLVLAIAFVAFSRARGVPVYLCALLFAFGNGIAWPSLSSFLANLVDDSVQGAVQGLSGSAGSLASILGLLAGGVIFESVGAKTFLIAAALIAVGALMSLRLSGLNKVTLTVDAAPQQA
ncbi:MAG: MFS transporter, partial [Myxococcota bacterium]